MRHSMEGKLLNKYFVSYSFKSNTGFGFGNTETSMKEDITDMNVVTRMRESIEDHYKLPENSVVILYFRRFE
jgi:hypothetical protein